MDVGLQKLVNSGILSNIYSQCNRRGDSQVLTQGFFFQSCTCTKTVWIGTTRSQRSLDESLVGVGTHFLPIMSVWAFWNDKLSVSFVIPCFFFVFVFFSGVRVIKAWLFLFSLQIFVPWCPLISNIPVWLCFDLCLATQCLQFWVGAPWNSMWNLSSSWRVWPCSQLDLFDSYWDSLPYPDAIVPGTLI